MSNEKEINYYKSILKRDKYILENNIKFFNSKGIKFDETYKEKYENDDFKTEKFYLSLKIPKQIIELELNSVVKFCGFPFFLRREGANLEVILMHEYPKGNYLFVKLPPKSHIADESKEISLTIEKIDELLREGFEWFHESQYKALW